MVGSSARLGPKGNKEVAQRIGDSHSIPVGHLSPLVTWTILGITRVLCCSFSVFVEPGLSVKPVRFTGLFRGGVWLCGSDRFGCLQKKDTYNSWGFGRVPENEHVGFGLCAEYHPQPRPSAQQREQVHEQRCIKRAAQLGHSSCLWPGPAGSAHPARGPFYTLFSWLAKGDHV